MEKFEPASAVLLSELLYVILRTAYVQIVEFQIGSLRYPANSHDNDVAKQLNWNSPRLYTVSLYCFD